MEYYVYLTNDCNLKCSYCSVMLQQEQTQFPQTISYPINKLVQFVNQTQEKYQEEYANIYFFGGEPTLEMLMMHQIICAFKNTTQYKVRFILHTNGLLLSKVPEYILDKIDIIFLSLNYEKIFNNGLISPYFSGIINSLNIVKTYKPIPIIGRLTVSKETSLYTECCIMGTFFDYVYWQLDNQKIITDINEYKEQYQRDISLLFNYWLAFWEKHTVLRYIPFLSIIQHYLNDTPIPEHFYCGYGDDIVYIQTDGTCYACCDEVEARTHFVGNIDDGIVFKNMKIEGTVCEDCSYLTICGGRCGRMHKDFNAERIQYFCDMNIFTFDLVKSAMPRVISAIECNPKLLDAINDPLMSFSELIP